MRPQRADALHRLQAAPVLRAPGQLRVQRVLVGKGAAAGCAHGLAHHVNLEQAAPVVHELLQHAGGAQAGHLTPAQASQALLLVHQRQRVRRLAPVGQQRLGHCQRRGGSERTGGRGSGARTQGEAEAAATQRSRHSSQVTLHNNLPRGGHRGADAVAQLDARHRLQHGGAVGQLQE